jgi:hypothetical protein
MNCEAYGATQEEWERLQAMASRYCTCGWPNPLRVGKPECNAHALLADRPALTDLLSVYRRRARLLVQEFGAN